MTVEADMENADHESDLWSGGSFGLGGSGAFVQHKTLMSEPDARRMSMERDAADAAPTSNKAAP